MGLDLSKHELAGGRLTAQGLKVKPGWVTWLARLHTTTCTACLRLSARVTISFLHCVLFINEKRPENTRNKQAIALNMVFNICFFSPSVR